MKKAIPNAITLLNLFCGCIAVIFVINNHFVTAALFVFLGIFFDFFDGFAARILNAQSALGLQLDSLADVVTSGLVPGLVVYKLLQIAELSWDEYHLVPYFGLAITLASAYRLAKFNIDDEQQSYFKGLPTPANALLIVSLPLILEYQNSDAMNAIILNKWFLFGITILSCYLLNSNIKLFALKFKDYSFTNNVTRYVFLLLSVVLIIVLQFAAIPLIILLYISLSVLNNFSSK
ncbi:CDP-alcohol phosphatidyltransferase family protein [Tamlana sp. 62-3]|uniref:CDP-alcohol phosphatidyltransferase family protein n=1 Tax=Neotamlana sargassicola TaxID=2883125 RepID=A0A9X1I9A3_9FLAO|nr:CDP-alcohol phosphatidyltransferase family protein [Tamlana sargassicola]MCB4808704.1 CDP-alcohol phosphatidyltransferase family protein [Tamlana sargassicola]